jgi:hypothetical protein
VLVNDVTNSILKNELMVFQGLLMWSIDHENPLVWWVEHVVQFSHVSFQFIKCLELWGCILK